MASVSRQRSAARANTTLGADLQRCRKARGWSIEAASQATKIKPDQIRAIEANDFGNFPSTAYLRGFLRIYARAVGLDERIVLAKFDGKPTVPEQDMVSATAIDALPPVTRQTLTAPRIPALWLVGGGVAAAVMLGVAWTIYRVGPKNISDSARNASLADSAPKAEQVVPGAAPAAVVVPPRAEVVKAAPVTPSPEPVATVVNPPAAPPAAVVPAVEETAPTILPQPPTAGGNRLGSSIPKAALVRLPKPSEALASTGPTPAAGSISVTPIETVMKSPKDVSGMPRAFLVHPAQVNRPEEPESNVPVIKPQESVVASSQGPSPATEGSAVSTAGGVPRAVLARAESTLSLEANSEVWLRVVVNGNEDEEAFNGVLIPGQKLNFKGQRFYVKTAQPNALVASLNGEPRRVLGNSPSTAEFNFAR